MGKVTAISWTDHTFNGWWGCVEAGPECDRCYARTTARAYGWSGSGKDKPLLWGKDAARRLFGDKHWGEPLKWNAAAEKAGVRRRVFAFSMADILDDRRDLDEPRARTWDLVERTPWLDWLLLTKRPALFAKLTPASWRSGAWPRNAWAGTTAGAARTLAANAPALCTAAAAAPLRFLSVEPMLEALGDLGLYLGPRTFVTRAVTRAFAFASSDDMHVAPGVDWVIFGGESGHGARPMPLNWVREGIAQCRLAGVAPFVKQLGAAWTDYQESLWQASRGLEGGKVDAKGAKPEEWPEDLRVQEIPAVPA